MLAISNGDYTVTPFGWIFLNRLLLCLQEHPEITKSERKRICRLMDCRKLSVDASAHAVQNERLPLRVVVQVLFFEQVRSQLRLLVTALLS